MATQSGRLPEDPQDRDLQTARSAAKTYGLVNRDPQTPVEGWTWIRRDLSPPELRVKVSGTVYKTAFTPA